MHVNGQIQPTVLSVRQKLDELVHSPSLKHCALIWQLAYCRVLQGDFLTFLISSHQQMTRPISLQRCLILTSNSDGCRESILKGANYYNTMIPSSAPVKRLFSFGGIIRNAKRNRLADTTFETFLMLKSNANISMPK